MRELMLFLHFIGLAMGLGTSFGHAFLASVTSKMTPEESTKFRLHTLALGRMGHVGITLLIVSGLYLLTPYWKTFSSMPLLMLKLVLVIALVIIIVLLGRLSKKALTGDADLQLQKMAKLGKMTMLIALVIVGLAIYIFR